MALGRELLDDLVVDIANDVVVGLLDERLEVLVVLVVSRDVVVVNPPDPPLPPQVATGPPGAVYVVG